MSFNDGVVNLLRHRHGVLEVPVGGDVIAPLGGVPHELTHQD